MEKRRQIILMVMIFLSVMFVLSVVTASKGDTIEKKDKKVRLLAHSEKEVEQALTEGCQIVKLVRKAKLTTLRCPTESEIATKLQEDIKFFALDTKANTQIKADLIQNVGNNGVGKKIVILDSGIEYNHPELSSSYLGGKDFVNSDSDPLDDNGHGTHVAGIITADGISAAAKGVAPDAGIIAGKVLDESGAGFFSDIIDGIYWAVDGDDGIAGDVCNIDNSTGLTTCTNDDFKADAISMSLGTGSPYLYKGFCDNVYPALTNAIKYAKEHGTLTVVAAGNSGNAGVSLPGCISYSTTVGAVDFNDKIASFSGRGKSLDIVAPGVSIYSTWLNRAYAIASGTSMATPMVSGTVALIKSQHPDWTPAKVEDALFKTAKNLGKSGKDNNSGWGRVDAYSAVNFI
ncbi:S8 family peptidase [Candidatus Pacearchaeota archaeon]|nr:S8 family peptidase [Candidatus Pacearchaeota archaeon]